MKNYSLKEILDSLIAKSLINTIFNGREIEILTRPGSHILKLKVEPEEKVTRVIILPPKGFTSNEIDELSSHPEARIAKITIRGGIRPNNSGFNLLKDSIKYAFYTKRDIPTKQNYPYAKIDKNNSLYKEEIKSARERFLVVRKNGSGFYHNLINLSNEWVLLILEKEINLQKEMNISKLIKKLNYNENKIILKFVEEVKNYGDEVFIRDKEIIESLLKLNTVDVIPVLINALNINESGRHEQCTIYALILKFAKKDKETTLELVKEALKNREAQDYYLKELIKKIEKLN